jgi:hypothetical protein
MFQCDGNDLVVSPVLTFGFEGDYNIGLSTMVRKAYKNGSIGTGMFFDVNHSNFGSFQQLGLGIDYITNYSDVRMNFYNPLRRDVDTVFPTLWGHYMHELSVAFKSTDFRISLSAIYDYTEDEIGTKIGIDYTKYGIGLLFDIPNMMDTKDFDVAIRLSLFKSNEGTFNSLRHNNAVRF